MLNPMAPGCTFFLPHGTRIFNRLQELMRRQYFLRGYTEVNTPTMFKNELWKTSGHFFKYAKDMFFVNTEEKEEFGIKPMNCPSHCLVFKNDLKSFRDLP
jgi:threonyl-tRNA synthetase